MKIEATVALTRFTNATSLKISHCLFAKKKGHSICSCSICASNTAGELIADKAGQRGCFTRDVKVARIQDEQIKN